MLHRIYTSVSYAAGHFSSPRPLDTLLSCHFFLENGFVILAFCSELSLALHNLRVHVCSLALHNLAPYYLFSLIYLTPCIYKIAGNTHSHSPPDLTTTQRGHKHKNVTKMVAHHFPKDLLNPTKSVFLALEKC